MPGKWSSRLCSGRSWRATGRTLRNAVTLIPRYASRLANFWISLLGLASFAVLLWILEPIGDFTAQVVATGLYVVMSFLHLLDGFSSDPQRRRIELSTTWPSLLSFAALAIALAARANMPIVVIGIASILASAFPLWVFWMVSKGRWLWLLLFAAVPSVVAASLYLIPPITPSGLVFDYLLVPLPVLSYACIAWVLVAKWFLIRAYQMRRCPIWGPATESLSMLFLFTPFIALMMLAVNALGFSETWVAVSGVVVGLVFSSAISVPARQFLLDLAGLSPDRGSEGERGQIEDVCCEGTSRDSGE